MPGICAHKFRRQNRVWDLVLAFLLDLNFACAAREAAGEAITPPGLPLPESGRAAFVTDDCIRV